MTFQNLNNKEKEIRVYKDLQLLTKALRVINNCPTCKDQLKQTTIDLRELA